MTSVVTEVAHTASGSTNTMDREGLPVAETTCAPGLPLWARPEARTALGDTLRPGGFSLTDRLATLAGVHPGWRVLDVGCGTGATVLHLRQRYGASAFGCDRSTSLTQGSKNHKGLPVIAADAASLPFADGSMEMVLCECVLSLLEHPLQVLCELRRLLVPGGLLGISDLYLRGEGHVHVTEGSCLAWKATRMKIENLLHEAGFALRTFEDHSPLLRETAARLALSGALGREAVNCGERALPSRGACCRCSPEDLAATPQATSCGMTAASATPLFTPPVGAHVARPGYFLLLAQSLKGTRKD